MGHLVEFTNPIPSAGCSHARRQAQPHHDLTRSLRRRVTGPLVLATFRRTAAAHGVPASTLTDNGLVFTTRFSGGKGGRNHLEHELRELNITQKNGHPHHPQTQGKVERFQQTLNKWLRAQPTQPASLA